jgi:hypothetical protein
MEANIQDILQDIKKNESSPHRELLQPFIDEMNESVASMRKSQSSVRQLFDLHLYQLHREALRKLSWWDFKARRYLQKTEEE